MFIANAQKVIVESSLNALSNPYSPTFNNIEMKYLILTLALFCSAYAANGQNIDRKQLLRDVEILSSDVYEGRKTGTIENGMAAKYIIERFKNIGLTFYQDSFKHPFLFKSKTSENLKGTNLIGYIKGRKKDVIVITAHYDHIGIIKNLINNGADDNASGVAGLLAIAEYYKKHKPKNTLLFIAFDA
ncbi:MAG: peptidase, partial [Daejeonella sp.]|nr:peptidase [Daejeonella sp.]